MYLIYCIDYDNELFSKNYNFLLVQYGFRDAFFWFKNQRIRVSTVRPEFFDDVGCFIKLGKETIIFELTNDIHSFTGQYAYFSEPNKSIDIVFLPFNWYTRDPIFNTDSAYIRAIDNKSYQICSLGFSPLTFLNEKSDSVVYANSLPIEAYNLAGKLIPLKLRPNGIAQAYKFFRLSFPGVVDQFLIYNLVQGNRVSVTYNDGVYYNNCETDLQVGLNYVKMYQDNPTNPNPYSKVVQFNRSALLSSVVDFPKINYELLPEFVNGYYTYNADRTLTAVTGGGPQPPDIQTQNGYYMLNIPGSNDAYGSYWIYLPETVSDGQCFSYDARQDLGYVEPYGTMRGATNILKPVLNGLYNNSVNFSVVYDSPVVQNDILVASGYPSWKRYGDAWAPWPTTDILFNNVLTLIDTFTDNGTTITIGPHSSTNTGILIYGLNDYSTISYNGFNGGDMSYISSTIMGNFQSSFYDVYNYRVYLVKIADYPNKITYGDIVNYYKSWTFIGEPLELFGYQYPEPTRVIIVSGKKQSALVQRFGVVDYPIDVNGIYKGFLCIFTDIIPNGSKVALGSYYNTARPGYGGNINGGEYGNLRILSSFFNNQHDVYLTNSYLTMTTPTAFGSPTDYILRFKGENSYSQTCGGVNIDPVNAGRWWLYYDTFVDDINNKTFTLGNFINNNSTPTPYLIYGCDLATLTRPCPNTDNSALFFDLTYEMANTYFPFQHKFYFVDLSAGFNNKIVENTTVTYYDSQTVFFDGTDHFFNYKRQFKVPTRVFARVMYKQTTPTPQNVIYNDFINNVNFCRMAINPNIYFAYTGSDYYGTNRYDIRPGIGPCTGLGNTLNQNLVASCCFKLCSNINTESQAKCLLMTAGWFFGAAPRFYWNWFGNNRQSGSPSTWEQYPVSAPGSGIAGMIPEGVWTTIPLAQNRRNFAVQITNDTYNMTLGDIPQQIYFIVDTGGDVLNIPNIFSPLPLEITDIAVNNQTDLIGNPIRDGSIIRSIYDTAAPPYGQKQSGIHNFDVLGVNGESNMYFVKAYADIPIGSVALFQNDLNQTTRQLLLDNNNRFFFTSFDHTWINDTLPNNNTSGTMTLAFPQPDMNIGVNQIKCHVGTGNGAGFLWGAGNPNTIFDDPPFTAERVFVNATTWTDNGIDTVIVGNNVTGNSWYYGADYENSNDATRWCSNMYCKIDITKANDPLLRCTVYFIEEKWNSPRIVRGTATGGPTFIYYKKIDLEGAMSLSFQYDRLTRIIIKLYHSDASPITGFTDTCFIGSLPCRYLVKQNSVKPFNALLASSYNMNMSTIDLGRSSVFQETTTFGDSRFLAQRVSNAGVNVTNKLRFFLATSNSRRFSTKQSNYSKIAVYNGAGAWNYSAGGTWDGELVVVNDTNIINNHYFLFQIWGLDYYFQNWDSIFHDFEIYAFMSVADNADVIIGSFPDRLGIGNYYNMLKDQNGNTMAPNQQVPLINPIPAPADDTYGPVDFTDWKLHNTLSIGMSPTRLFTSNYGFNNPDIAIGSYGVYPPLFGMDGDPYDTFNNIFDMSAYIILNKSPDPDNGLGFILTSKTWKTTGVQTYRFNVFGKDDLNQDFPYPDDGSTIGEGTIYGIPSDSNCRMVAVQIGKIGANITIDDILNDVEIYLFQNYHYMNVPIAPFTAPMLTLSSNFYFDIDLFNNPVILGSPIYDVPPGNQYSGYINYDVGIPETLFIQGPLRLFSQFNKGITDQYGVYGTERLVYKIENFDQNMLSSMKPYPGILDPDNMFALTRGNATHIWGKDLKIADVTSVFGCNDTVTGQYFLTRISDTTETGNSLYVGPASPVSKALVSCLDVGNNVDGIVVPDYTYWGSNMYAKITNDAVPAGITYTIYYLSVAVNFDLFSNDYTYTFYQKYTFIGGQTISINERFTELTRIIIVMKWDSGAQITFEDFGDVDTLRIGALPIKLFSNRVFYDLDPDSAVVGGYRAGINNYYGYKVFAPQFNINGVIRINGKANAPISGRLGLMSYSKGFNQTGDTKYQIKLYTYDVESSHDVNNNTLYGPFSEGDCIITDTSAGRNFISITLYNDNSGQCQNIQNVLDTDFYLGELPSGTLSADNSQLATNGYLNYGNSFNGFFQGTLEPVTGPLDPILITVWPPLPPVPPVDDIWVLPLPVKIISSLKPTLYFSTMTDANRFALDIYVSDPDDITKFTIVALNVVLTLETEFELLKRINYNVGLAIQCKLIDPTTYPVITGEGSISSNFSRNVSLFASDPDYSGFLPPSQMFITPLNFLYSYTLDFTEFGVDIIFGARVPYAGFDFKNNPTQFEGYALRTMTPYDPILEAIQNPLTDSTTRSILFPSMNDYYHNYSYSIAKYYKSTESSRIFICEQQWSGQENDYHPPQSTTGTISGTIVNCLDAVAYNADEALIYRYYHPPGSKISLNRKYYVDEDTLYKTGIRIYRNNFDIDNYLQFTQSVEKVLLIHHCLWTYNADTKEYTSKELTFPQQFGYYNYVAAYIPITDFQVHGVTVNSDFVPGNQCYLYSSLVRNIRGKPQLLFIQNNLNRTSLYTSFYWAPTFTLTCSRTVQYIFLLFDRRNE